MPSSADATAADRRIRVGVGGWTYEPWRDNFFPKGLPHARELAHASRELTAIEINGTFYRTQNPAVFAKWRDETPDDFVFSLKATRYATNRARLAEAGESVQRFVSSGIAELGPKLGPIAWQLAPTKRFDADDVAAFLALLPGSVDGLPLRHVLEVRHDSFACAEYVDIARRHGVATVFTDSVDYPSFADTTGPFVYARLMRARAEQPTGYDAGELDAWATHAKTWARGEDPEGLPRIQQRASPGAPRDVFVFFINGAKERAPAAATALIGRLR